MKQAIAMHGWAGDSSVWMLWSRHFEQRGWQWLSGERGYGSRSAQIPAWMDGSTRRLVICHSLGFHLLPASVLSVATDLVLLGGFACFAPEGVQGRRLKTALKGMAQALGTDQETAMLQRFLDRAASPFPLSALPPNALLQGISETGRQRLRDDLNLLANLSALPPGCPDHASVLVVQGDLDQIVPAETQELLTRSLEDRLGRRPTVLLQAGCGHALLTADALQRVLAWLERP